MNFHAPDGAFAPAARLKDSWRDLRFSRATLRKLLMIGVPLLVAVVASVLWLTGGRYVSTDNAYIQAPKLMVSADVSGIVSDVLVHEGQRVRKGDVLFRIDPAQFQIAVDKAKAELAQTALNLQSMKEDYRRLLSDAASQAAQVALAQKTYDRSAELIKKGATTGQAFDQARAALDAAVKQQQSLREQAKVLLAKLGGDPDLNVATHPTYLEAKAQLDEAQRQLRHTIIRAPFDGVVTHVADLQPGIYLVAATAALTNSGAVALVATDDVWIDANFKETDLTWVKPGEDVDISVDTYPGRTWKGKVETIAPATGSEFAILPAENSSGNWVKVVQRIPVRIAVEQVKGDPPLRAGMSTYVSIDTGHRRALSDLL